MKHIGDQRERVTGEHNQLLVCLTSSPSCRIMTLLQITNVNYK